jgi:hypothetical protein
MMGDKILADVLALATETLPLPSFSDEAAVQAWMGKLTQGVTKIVYDAISGAADPHAALLAISTETFAASEVNKACEAIGDGTILNFLKSVNWAQVISTVVTIISLFPKTPAPVPTPAG